MSNTKLPKQIDHDKELKNFIDTLAKIELNFKPNTQEALMIEQSGFTCILYTVCMMKSLMSQSDTQIKNSLKLSSQFYKYIVDALKDHFDTLETLAFNYGSALVDNNTEYSKEKLIKSILNYYSQGHEYLKENYYPKNISGENYNILDSFNDIIGSQIDPEEIEEKLEIINKKLDTIISTWDKNIDKWGKKVKSPEKTTTSDLTTILNMTSDLIDHVIELGEINESLFESYLVQSELCDEYMGFLYKEGLLDKFNENIQLLNEEKTLETPPPKKPKKI